MPEPYARETQTAYRKPLVDVFETDEAVVLQFEMPGVAPDNITVGVDGDTLTVESRGREDTSGGRDVLLMEFAPTDFRREFLLSSALDRSNIDASWKDGVLTLTLPKAPENRSHKIEIKTQD